MQRYYFHWCDGPESVTDEEGLELADAEAALVHAKRCIREIVAHAVLAGQPVPWAAYLVVHDSRDTEIGKLGVREVVIFPRTEADAHVRA